MKAMKLGVLFRWVVVAGMMVGCLSPTLPIPPPDSAVASAPDTQGVVTVKGNTGSAKPSALVSVWNSNYVGSDNIVGIEVARPAAPDGSWSVSIPGKTGDLLYIWQTIDSERSPEIYVYVPAP